MGSDHVGKFCYVSWFVLQGEKMVEIFRYIDLNSLRVKLRLKSAGIAENIHFVGIPNRYVTNYTIMNVCFLSVAVTLMDLLILTSLSVSSRTVKYEVLRLLFQVNL